MTHGEGAGDGEARRRAAPPGTHVGRPRAGDGSGGRTRGAPATKQLQRTGVQASQGGRGRGSGFEGRAFCAREGGRARAAGGFSVSWVGARAGPMAGDGLSEPGVETGGQAVPAVHWAHAHGATRQGKRDQGLEFQAPPAPGRPCGQGAGGRGADDRLGARARTCARWRGRSTRGCAPAASRRAVGRSCGPGSVLNEFGAPARPGGPHAGLMTGSRVQPPAIRRPDMVYSVPSAAKPAP
jgi:hypothetical protein